MNTNKFLRGYLAMEARVTICNDRGSILYEGALAELRVAITRHTRIKSIEGLGSKDDIIITVTEDEK